MRDDIHKKVSVIKEWRNYVKVLMRDADWEDTGEIQASEVFRKFGKDIKGLLKKIKKFSKNLN